MKKWIITLEEDYTQKDRDFSTLALYVDSVGGSLMGEV